MGNGDEENRASAIKGFLDIFEQAAEEAKINEEKARKIFLNENLGSFLNKFNVNYKHYKKQFLKNFTNLSQAKFEYEVSRSFADCMGYLMRIDKLKIKKQYKEEAEWLGSALGCFLAVLEYGICNPEHPNYNYEETNIKQYIKDIASSMKTTGHGIRPKFITNRIKVIAKRTPKLSDENKLFLAEIAAEFS